MESAFGLESGNVEADTPSPTTYGERPSWWSSPWVSLLGITVGVAGLVLVLIAYVNVADSTEVELQIPYLVSGGIGGLFALGVAATTILARELRLDNERLRNVEEGIRAVETDVAALGEAVEDVLQALDAAAAHARGIVAEERVR